MFDFRYHALSLVAVFLALAVGLLLGVAIGDSGLVSSAKSDLEASLRNDVSSARGQISDLQGQLQRHTDYERQTYAELVAGRLAGERVGVVFLGGASDAVVNDVRTAIEPAGARLRYVGAVNEPPDVGQLGGRTADPRYRALGNGNGNGNGGASESGTAALGAFGQRAGRQLATGGKLLAAERSALMPSFTGRLGPVDAVVIVRSPTRPSADDAAGRTATGALEDGLVQGLDATGSRIVGAETVDADPSQVTWYRDHDLASVDSVDAVWGQAALVFALAGADGSWGVKPTAEALLPSLVGNANPPGQPSGG